MNEPWVLVSENQLNAGQLYTGQSLGLNWGLAGCVGWVEPPGGFSEDDTSRWILRETLNGALIVSNEPFRCKSLIYDPVMSIKESLDYIIRTYG